jgi:hypothetical protein
VHEEPAQTTLVVVAALTVSGVLPELSVWLASPAYEAVIVTVPSCPAPGVNLTLHEPPERVQNPPLLKVPIAGRLWENATVPVGVVGVPEMSVTVAVHVEGLPTAIGLGAHVTDVDVGWPQVTEAEPELIAWFVSPPYEPEIVTVPAKFAFGVKVTEQVPRVSVQVAAGVNAPEEAGFCVSVIVPVGVTLVPPDVSPTVMTQLVGAFRGGFDGVQTTVVEVDRWVAVNHIIPSLGEWLVSPG